MVSHVSGSFSFSPSLPRIIIPRHLWRFVQSRQNPTVSFAISEAQDQGIGEFYVVKKRHSTDFEVPKLRKGRSTSRRRPSSFLARLFVFLLILDARSECTYVRTDRQSHNITVWLRWSMWTSYLRRRRRRRGQRLSLPKLRPQTSLKIQNSYFNLIGHLA